ncbi:hypothetical protein EYF80_048646 [Liparis tanakae]|uniref:Uncharacterized protein n=1 Tax=Liparis tanakae TaxID=230148 RepID=A0A4Z2FJ10_9TELE|nr:hypothetical protein EYF80_048646 [Liparis tanakae]
MVEVEVEVEDRHRSLLTVLLGPVVGGDLNLLPPKKPSSAAASGFSSSVSLSQRGGAVSTNPLWSDEHKYVLIAQRSPPAHRAAAAAAKAYVSIANDPLPQDSNWQPPSPEPSAWARRAQCRLPPAARRPPCDSRSPEEERSTRWSDGCRGCRGNELQLSVGGKTVRSACRGMCTARIPRRLQDSKETPNKQERASARLRPSACLFSPSAHTSDGPEEARCRSCQREGDPCQQRSNGRLFGGRSVAALAVDAAVVCCRCRVAAGQVKVGAFFELPWRRSRDSREAVSHEAASATGAKMHL